MTSSRGGFFSRANSDGSMWLRGGGDSVQSSWTTFGLMRKEGCGLPVKVDGEDEQNGKFI